MLRSRLAAIVTFVGLVLGVLAVAGPPSVGAAHPERISGVDRYQTAAKISASRFASGVPVAYVVTGAKFPDALAAGVAAGAEGGPVLLTQRDTLPPATAAELDRLAPAEIVVVGGAGSVSNAVLDRLGSYTNGPVTRLDGAERFATAAAVADRTFPSGAAVVHVANGTTFPDALAGVPAAVHDGAPLLLVTRDTVPEATESAIRRLGPGHVVILGGAGTVSPGVEERLVTLAGSTERLAGADRFATAAEVSAERFPSGAPVAYLATGHSAADALAAGPVAAASGGPVLLVSANCIPPSVLDELSRLDADRQVILGGDRAVGPAVEDDVRCPSGSNLAGAPDIVGDPPARPTWDDDGPDPHVVRFGHRFYAYTTGTTWGNRIGVLVSDRPDGGWRTTTGETWGSTALPSVPDWQVPDTQWAPAVYRFAGRYVLFYAAQHRTNREWCLSVATASSPGGPFQDQTAATGPIVCLDHLDGVIDPHPFVDADGTPWLHFKNNDGIDGPNGVDAVSKIWAARLSADGTRPAGGYREVLAKDTSRYPWQTTLDNPQMVLRGGRYYLFHTGGDYVGNDTYATGYAVCDGPVGPCTTHPEPLLTSYGDVAGPGGGTVVRDLSGQWWLSYHAWTKSSCYDYGCGNERKLYVAPLRF